LVSRLLPPSTAFPLRGVFWFSVDFRRLWLTHTCSAALVVIQAPRTFLFNFLQFFLYASCFSPSPVRPLCNTTETQTRILGQAPLSCWPLLLFYFRSPPLPTSSAPMFFQQHGFFCRRLFSVPKIAIAIPFFCSFCPLSTLGSPF